MRRDQHHEYGSGTTHGYSVEVRNTNGQPETHPGGFIIDGEWRRVPYRVAQCDHSDHNHYQSGRIGDIPVWNHNHELTNLHLANFQAAYALACQIQAQLWNGGCVECRIVEVEVKYSYESKTLRLGEPISLSGLRQAMKFDKVEIPAPPEDEKEK